MENEEPAPKFVDAKQCAECKALLIAAEVRCPLCGSSEFIPAKGPLVERSIGPEPRR